MTISQLIVKLKNTGKLTMGEWLKLLEWRRKKRLNKISS